ncbi:Nucleoporin NDC1 [Dissophora globulifera]|uniref:Nucleoporin NDC1 n=1 Tax=Dissophora globulifera TaxID=979702 RepID=A0A9P6RC43_9FUNG|nr:Nucleoporin NDC1 [Dissophora globulifera]
MASILHTLILVPASTGAHNYSELVVYINERGIAQVNERYILTRTFSIVLGVFYGLSHLLYQRDWLSFTETQLSMVDFIFVNYWKGVVKKSASFAWTFAYRFWFSYNIIFSRFMIRLARRFAAEDIYSHLPQYGPRWYHFSLFFRLFLTAFSLSMFTESVHILCDHFLTKKLNITAESVDPSACLVTGLKVDGSNTTPESLLTYHAFQELNHLAGYYPARRTELFSEARMTPSSWKQISSHCMQLLNKAATRINNSSSTAPAAAKSSASPILNTSVRRRLPPTQGGAFETNIFKPSKHDHFLDSLKGATTEEILAQSRIEADKSLADPASGKRPNLAGSRERPELAAYRWLSQTVQDLVYKHPKLQEQLRNVPDARVFDATEDFQLTVWSFQSLARLVVASYKEDRFGIVQKDIPQVLETMLGLLMSLEHFLLTEGRLEKFVSSPYSAHVNAQRLVNGRSLALVEALRTSIYQIVETFKGQLHEFVLSKAYADRLQHFVEFSN